MVRQGHRPIFLLTDRVDRLILFLTARSFTKSGFSKPHFRFTPIVFLSVMGHKKAIQ
jgi:hypothetical protein